MLLVLVLKAQMLLVLVLRSLVPPLKFLEVQSVAALVAASAALQPAELLRHCAH